MNFSCKVSVISTTNRSKRGFGLQFALGAAIQLHCTINPLRWTYSKISDIDEYQETVVVKIKRIYVDKRL